MKPTWEKAVGHFKTINHHKLLVMELCFKLGLYKQGLLHDLSKYAPIEFLVGAKYYQGDRSPNNAEREERGYTAAWLHHKGRNLHHMEYWIDYSIEEEDHKMAGMKMPTRYVVEMFADRVAACKNYQGAAYTDRSSLTYYEKGKGHYMLHHETARLLEFMLRMLAVYGEEKTCRYIRRYILKNDRYCKRRGIRSCGEYDGYEVLQKYRG